MEAKSFFSSLAYLRGAAAVLEVSDTERYLGYCEPGIGTTKAQTGWNILKVYQDGGGVWLYQWAYSLGDQFGFKHIFANYASYTYA